MSTDPVSLLLLVLTGFAIPLVALLAGVVCLVYMRLSKWLLLAMLGFVGVAFFTFVNSIVGRIMPSRTLDDFRHIGMFHAAVYVVIAFMYLLIAGGLALAFMDVQKQLRRRSDEPRDALAANISSEPRETWQSKQEGGHDIQH